MRVVAAENAKAGNVNQNPGLPEPPLEEIQRVFVSCLPCFLPLRNFCAFCGLFRTYLFRRYWYACHACFMRMQKDMFRHLSASVN